MKKMSKQPRDVMDYDVSLETWFKKKAPLDDIESVSLTVTSPTESNPTLELGPVPHPESLLIGTPAHRIKIWVGGGTNNTDYLITGLVVTEQDRQKEFEFMIKVKDKK